MADTKEKKDDLEVKIPKDGEDIEVVFEDAPSTKIAKDEAAALLAEKEERDRAEAERKAAASPPKVETTVPDDGSESLKRQLEDMKRRNDESNRRMREALQGKEEAERRARSETERREKVESESSYTRLNLITNAIDAVNQRADAAERDYRLAMESQDFAAAAKAQRAMSNAESRLTALEAEKVTLEGGDMNRQLTEGRVQPQRQQQVEQRQQPIVVADRVDELAKNLSAASAAWIRSHPECVTDPVLNSEMIAAHNRAVRNGIPVDSDSYFEFIESRLGFGTTPADTKPVNGARHQNGAEVELPKEEPPQRRPSVAAPVSRDVPTNSGATSTPRTYTLSPAEREFCDMSDGENPDRYKDYARSKIALAKEGKLSNNRLN